MRREEGREKKRREKENRGGATGEERRGEVMKDKGDSRKNKDERDHEVAW